MFWSSASQGLRCIPITQGSSTVDSDRVGKGEPGVSAFLVRFPGAGPQITLGRSSKSRLHASHHPNWFPISFSLLHLHLSLTPLYPLSVFQMPSSWNFGLSSPYWDPPLQANSYSFKDWALLRLKESLFWYAFAIAHWEQRICYSSSSLPNPRLSSILFSFSLLLRKSWG